MFEILKIIVTIIELFILSFVFVGILLLILMWFGILRIK